MTDDRTQRKIDSLQQQWNTLTEHLDAFQDELAHETRVEEKLRIKRLITGKEQEREAIEQQLDELEQGRQRAADAEAAEQSLRDEAVAAINDLLQRCQLSEQFRARDEFTIHNEANRKLISQLREAIAQLPADTPGYHSLAIRVASALSSANQLPVAETLLIQAQTDGSEDEQALAAFNRFHLNVRQRDFDAALIQLNTAIQYDARRYALHDTGKYPIERLLGAGGMGCVFLCRDMLRGHAVVKCFWEAAPGPKETVFKEALIMGQLPGNSSPDIYDYGYVDSFRQERPYIVTEYLPDALDGEQWLTTHGPLNFPDGANVGLQISRALALAHQQNIYHLDLKPANLLLKQTPDSIHVSIIDFGLSKVGKSLKDEAVSRQHQPRSGLSMMGQEVFGTLNYAPPEQLGESRYGPPGAKSDLYAFGRTRYRLTSGDSAGGNFRRRNLVDWPDALFELLEDCVEDDPANRPGSAAVMVASFEQALEQPAPEPSPAEPEPEPDETVIPDIVPEPAPQSMTSPVAEVVHDKPVRARPERKPGFLKTWQVFGIVTGLVLLVGWLVYPLLKPAPIDEPSETTSTGTTEIGKTTDQPFRDTLKSGGQGPEMVWLPAGEFRMGSPDSEKGRDDDEGPVHKVSVGQFALGVKEVSKGEFSRFVSATSYKTEAEQGDGCYGWTGKTWEKDKKFNWRNIGFNQTDDHPVACMSWNDAIAYAEWISEQTGEKYRLPTEAEWEYAARAKTTTARYWGENPNQACRYANVADKTAAAKLNWSNIHDCEDNYIYTAPVGKFRANEFGLHDMLGNVWEWTCSAYEDKYAGKEKVCISKNDASRWVLRGGSWFVKPADVRAASRYWFNPSLRNGGLGFRLARM